MKILIFGGSFDPIHRGHVNILKKAIKEISPDKTFVIPSNKSHFKSRELSSYEHRVEMIKIALADLDNVEISNFEYESNIKSYTIDTIKHFETKFKGAELFLLIGSDNLNKFKSWKQYDEILEKVTLVSYKRESYCNCKTEMPNCNCKLHINDFENIININDELFDISSTEIRNGTCSLLSIPEITDYANHHGLYAVDRLSKYMGQKRLTHSIRTAEFAYKLMHKIDKNLSCLAYTTALYHDICKEVSAEKQEKIAREELNITDYPSWRVLHGPVGAHILKTKYGFKNEMMLNAIRRHTTPYLFNNNKDLTPLDMIVYLADKLEPNRTDQDVANENIKYYRDLLEKDYKKCFEELLEENSNRHKGK